MTERRRGEPSERDIPKEPTEAQRLVSQVGFFLDLTHTAKNAAREYARTAGLSKQATREVAGAFTDLYLLRAGGLPTEPFHTKWGDKAQDYARLVDEREQELREKSRLATENASQLTAKKRTAILAKAAFKLHRLADEQRQSLLETAGYTTEEGKHIRGKLVKSFVGSGITGFGVSPVVIGAITTHEAISPTINYDAITDPKMIAALAITYLAHYASMGLASYTNRRLLEHPEIENCPNAFATGLYYLVNKLNPDSEIATRRAVTTGGFLSTTSQEPFVFPAALALPFAGIVRNTGGMVANMTVATSNILYEGSVNWRTRRTRLREQE